MPVSNDDFAVYAAMVQAGFKRKTKHMPAAYARRLALEKRAQQRRYCDAFALWRACENAQCRRRQSCRGDAGTCLKRGLNRVPHEMQRNARQDIVAAIPGNLGAPEREARLRSAEDCLA
ncbi:MAG TPA: hypothetical protein VH206_05720 [Xanthobacteraceae bacterium]|nr:hypothetical protein [Xanthobacteraceae bacterium]